MPAPRPTSSPVARVQSARPTLGEATSCADAPSPEMVKAKQTCAEFSELDAHCDKDKVWTYHKYCQRSCFL